MDRLTLDDAQVDDKRAEALAANARLDGVWEADAAPTRTGEVCPGSLLRLFDDVQLRDGLIYRVIAPAEGRDRFVCWGRTDFGMTYTTASVFDVVDRAPVDPVEQAMPVLGTFEPPAETLPETPVWNPDLPALRQQAFAQIDQRSDLWFASGLVYEGVVYSLSERAQIRYQSMERFAELLVPITINSLDDTVAVRFETADALRAFCMTALSVVTGIVNDGGEQKEIVRGLQTGEELAAYQDPRPAPADVPLEPGQA
jgi:hypothetical protein